MKTRQQLITQVLCCAFAAASAFVQAETINTRIGKLSFTDGYPSKEVSAELYDALEYQRAVQAYIWAVPLVNSVALEKALTDAGVSPSEPSLLIFDKPLTPKQVIMTANSEVIYAFTVLDLAKTGPLVIESPAGALGAIVDFWMRAIDDMGIGPSRHGGQFLLLPQGYTGEVPSGYIVERSRTQRVFAFSRGIVTPGASTEPFVKLVSNIKIYPLAQKDAPRPTRIVFNGGKPFDQDWPKDARYFDYMAEGLSDAVVEPEDKLMYAMLKPLGMEPGKPFKPDVRVRGILQRAADTGAAMMTSIAFASRMGPEPTWPDRRWEGIISVTTPDMSTKERVELDERAQGWYQLVGNSRYGYGAKLKPGTGSWYVLTYKDRDGAKSYKFTLQPNPPAKQF
jgi:hypothetical protein